MVPIGSVPEKDRRATLVHEVVSSVASLRAIARVVADAGLDAWPDLPSVLLDEADRLAMLVDDCSQAGRSVAAWGSSPHATCHMPAILAAAQGYASRLQPDRRITVEVDISSEPIMGWPLRIEQVLRNLLDNALKYAPTGTPIRLCLATMPEYLSVSVIDHGPGLSSRDGDRIFLAGVRATSVAGSGGTGLGLAICRSIVEGWGGRIWSAATPGGGATFSFTLPRAVQRVCHPAADAVSPSS